MVPSSKGAFGRWFSFLALSGFGASQSHNTSVHTATGKVVALKIIDLDTPDDDITEIQREVALLSQLREADKYNCTLYYGCWMHESELWIVMEYASGGSIRTVVCPAPPGVLVKSHLLTTCLTDESVPDN
jgi:serine/threonine protein kinase